MSTPETKPTQNKIRVVTAASLFDGHDASINIMRRIMQAMGAEVIHLGHNRTAADVVRCAIQEDAQAVALTSYQGGHTEYFKYIRDLLNEAGCEQVRIFGGGGGVILPDEIADMHAHGITRIYSPDDGRKLGLEGMIQDLLVRSDFPTGNQARPGQGLRPDEHREIARWISCAENFPEEFKKTFSAVPKSAARAPVLGITGTGGAGKSSLVDELVRRFLHQYPDRNIAIVSIDPTRKRTGGALLGDRIRMNSISHPNVYMRSLATRQAHLSISQSITDALEVIQACGFDLVIVETAGIGQSDTAIRDFSDVALYVMTPEYGAATQLEKIDMIDYADAIAINKFDRKGSLDALRDVKKQWRRNRKKFDGSDDTIPVFGTIASQFNDQGTWQLFDQICELLVSKAGAPFDRKADPHLTQSRRESLIPAAKVRYLAEISTTIRDYNREIARQADAAHQLQAVATVRKLGVDHLQDLETELAGNISAEWKKKLAEWPALFEKYRQKEFPFAVRDKVITIETTTQSMSHLPTTKVSLPKYRDHGDLVRWMGQENLPGEFPYTAGVFPFKREEEDPTRMFAGEGGPERTNKRFHYVSEGMPAKRLSTAFDSVTLYGENPDHRPDIYGKIGNAGVSVCCLDDAKKLYSGFRLSDPKTSVSMTINGPAPMLVGFFLNAAIDQECEIALRALNRVDEVEKKITEEYRQAGLPRPRYEGDLPRGNDGLGLLLLGSSGADHLPADVYAKIKAETMQKVRGTVQADIFKEDQAQNTCIFSTEFAVKMMGDIQGYFIQNKIRNFYSVSISGYHIAEAGANPITQLAFTLSNGFTLVEYYLARGYSIDEFAANLSFFFSNGLDPEYAVIGRVARRIWAKAMRERYGANARSQMLKYHIQTSGRSLHAQEIDFNDIRTTLQALYAIFDNCNSLHTNAYDEAITTPTEESVRRAMAIQLIINKELGLAKNQNPLQGSFIIEELTDLVEEAVLTEFDRLNDRGGVLGAMETMYQRGKIQEESMHYEHLKHSGELPLIGVNTFLSKEGSPTVLPREVIRSTEAEKQAQILQVERLRKKNPSRMAEDLESLRQAALRNQNIFETLMTATRSCSLGDITETLYQVGGQYRRNM